MDVVEWGDMVDHVMYDGNGDELEEAHDVGEGHRQGVVFVYKPRIILHLLGRRFVVIVSVRHLATNLVHGGPEGRVMG